MISGIILAGGASRRMGQQKLLMKWGKMTILEHVVSIARSAGIHDLVVVTGASHVQLEERVKQLPYPVRVAYNEDYTQGDMLSSLQCGLRVLRDGASNGALVVLGDQPQMEERTVRLVCESYATERHPLVAPSYRNRRGHPWLVDRSLWDELLDMKPPLTPRDFLFAHGGDIRYVDVDNASILADLDTLQDYTRAKP
jgi:molybdenum cofactor cytidylyltransferase